MEALEVFPVLIKNVPSNTTVNQLYNNIFCHTNWTNCAKHTANLVFYSSQINNKREWLMVFKNMTSQLDAVHYLNQANPGRKHQFMALIPYQPYLNIKVTKSNLKEMRQIHHHRYQCDNRWISYAFLNCLAINISEMMQQTWILVPIHCDKWHLIILDKVKFKNPLIHNMDRETNWLPVLSSADFAGFILNRNNSANVKLRKRYQKDSVGLLYNKNWKSHHIFELTDAFVDKRSLLNHKKAIFNLCLAESAFVKHSKKIQTILNLKPEQHFYAINVRIAMDRNLKQSVKRRKRKLCEVKPSQKRRKPRIIQNRKRLKNLNHLSRLIDVRFWNSHEIKDFLAMSVDGKYVDIFMAHNLRGKRLEFLTVALLIYCGIAAYDANHIIHCKNFFIDCQQIVQEYEMNKGGHINKGQNDEIRSKIDALNAILTECVTNKYICNNKQCVSFLAKYEQLYDYINNYIRELQKKMLKCNQSEYEGRNKLIKDVKRKANIVMENDDAFIHDYALFSNEKPIKQRGCILIKLENIKFCSWFYGNICAESIIKLMEKKLLSLCYDNAMYNNYEYKIKIYTKANSNEYVILCSPNICLNQFKSFCLLLTRMTYQIPKFWEPICSSNNIKQYNKCLRLQKPNEDECARKVENGFYQMSPSQEIEGRPRKKNNNCIPYKVKQIHDRKKSNKHRKDSLLARSLSKIIKTKHAKDVEEDRSCFLMNYYNDDAASISRLSRESEADEYVNNENCNSLNKCIQPKKDANGNQMKDDYLNGCKALKSVFVSVCGVFNDSVVNIEYYEECEKLQKKLSDKLLALSNNGTHPLRLFDGFDINEICVLKTF